MFVATGPSGFTRDFNALFRLLRSVLKFFFRIHSIVFAVLVIFLFAYLYFFFILIIIIFIIFVFIILRRYSYFVFCLLFYFLLMVIRRPFCPCFLFVRLYISILLLTGAFYSLEV
jgi:hypothetical protein